jgi:hypothetical protein
MGNADTKICTNCKTPIANTHGRYRIPEIGEFHPGCWEATRLERIPESSNWALVVALEAWLTQDLGQFINACNLLGQEPSTTPGPLFNNSRPGWFTSPIPLELAPE